MVSLRVVLNVIQNTDFFIQISKMSIVSIAIKYRNITYYTRGIWRCYFTCKLYLHSPSAHLELKFLKNVHGSPAYNYRGCSTKCLK